MGGEGVDPPGGDILMVGGGTQCWVSAPWPWPALDVVTELPSGPALFLLDDFGPDLPPMAPGTRFSALGIHRMVGSIGTHPYRLFCTQVSHIRPLVSAFFLQCECICVVYVCAYENTHMCMVYVFPYVFRVFMCGKTDGCAT